MIEMQKQKAYHAMQIIHCFYTFQSTFFFDKANHNQISNTHKQGSSMQFKVLPSSLSVRIYNMYDIRFKKWACKC